MRIAWQSANGPRARGYGWKRMAGCGWMDRWMGRRWCMDGWALQVLRLDEIQMHSTAPAISTNELILPPARFFFSFFTTVLPFSCPLTLGPAGCCISPQLTDTSFTIVQNLFPVSKFFRLIVRSIDTRIRTIDENDWRVKTIPLDASFFRTITSLPLLTKRPFNLDIISRLFV